MSEVANKELPKNWELTTLGKVTLPIEKVKPANEPVKEILYLDIGGIDKGANTVVDYKKYLGKDAPSRAQQAIKKGDIAFASVRPYLRNIAIVPNALDNQVGSTGFCFLRPAEGVSNKYIYYWVLSNTFINDITKYQKGSSYPAVTNKQILERNIPLAPPEQQKRIVAKIEELFSHIDAGIEALKKAKQLLKQYRQSVLKAAVTGKLTEQWRADRAAELDAQGSANAAGGTTPGAATKDETAKQLLERILKERRQKWEEQQLEQFKAKGLPAPKKDRWWLYVLLCDDNSFYIGVTEDMPRRWKEHGSGQGAEHTKKNKPISIIHHEEFKSQIEAYNREKELKTGFGRKWLKREYEKGALRQAGKMPKDDKWKEKYKEPVPAVIESLPEIPEEWVWVTLPQLGELNRGKSKHRPRNDPSLYGGDYPFVQTGDVRAANTWLKEYSKTYADKGLNQSRLWPKGTMCITIAANIADTAILDLDACFPDSVVGFIPLNDSVNVEVVEFFIRTVKSDLEKYAPATAQKNINLAILETVAIPLLPEAEQEVLINSLKYKMSMADRLEEEIDHQLIKTEKNKQSILSSAFSES